MLWPRRYRDLSLNLIHKLLLMPYTVYRWDIYYDYCIVLNYIALNWIVLYPSVVNWIVLLCCIVFYCIVLYCIALCYVVFSIIYSILRHVNVFKNTWCDLHHLFCSVMWIVALFLILDSYIISITNSGTHTLLSINSIIMFLYPLSSFSHINLDCCICPVKFLCHYFTLFWMKC